MDLKEFERKLFVLGYMDGLSGFKKKSILLGVGVSLAGIFYSTMALQSEKMVLLSMLAFFAPAILIYFYIIYLFELRKKKIEEQIPDVLLIASSLPEKTSMKKLISFMAEKGEPPLKEEFGIVLTKIDKGMSIEAALDSMKQRTNSFSLNRAIDLLTNALKSGTNMSRVFREAADDFIQTNSIARERGVSITIEKYTLLIAGGILVPLILGLLTGMIEGMDFSTISDLGIGLSQKQRLELVNATLLGNLIYIAEYCLIASAFVGFQEGRQNKAFVYALVLLPLGFLAYFLGKGF